MATIDIDDSRFNPINLYGPAATYANGTISPDGYGDIDVGGVLSCLVVQSNVDIVPTFTQSESSGEVEGEYSPQIKGPYRVLKDCEQCIGLELNAALATFGLPIDRKMAWPLGPAADDYQWVVRGVQVYQLEAGEHAVLTLRCRWTQIDKNSGQIDPQTALSSVDQLDSWDLTWEPYTIRAVGFCANARVSPRVKIDVPVQPGQSIQGLAEREFVDLWLDNETAKGVVNDHRWVQANDGQGYFLNDAEELVVNHALGDRSALWHSPILKHSTVWEGQSLSKGMWSVPFTQPIGEYLDQILYDQDRPALVPVGAPYEFGPAMETSSGPKYWKWIKTNDSLVQTKTKSGNLYKIRFERVEEFRGVIDAYVNYYGTKAFDHNNLATCRWIPGEV